jgi:hypothetical protein
LADVVPISRITLSTSPFENTKMGSVRHLTRAAEALVVGKRSIMVAQIVRQSRRVNLYIDIPSGQAIAASDEYWKIM